MPKITSENLQAVKDGVQKIFGKELKTVKQPDGTFTGSLTADAISRDQIINLADILLGKDLHDVTLKRSGTGISLSIS